MFIYGSIDPTVSNGSQIATFDGSGGGGIALLMIVVVVVGALVMIWAMRTLSPTMAIVHEPVKLLFRAMMFGLVVGALAFICVFAVFTSPTLFSS